MTRVIVTDLDGTLTSRDLVLSPKVIEAVRIAKKHGIRIRIATGNAFPIATAVSRYTGMNDYVISENGCIIGKHGIIRKTFGDPEESRKAFEYARDVLKAKPKPRNDRRRIDFVFEPSVDPKRLEEELRKAGFRVRVTYSGYAVHVLPEGVSKGKALRRLLEYKNIPRERVVAIGDGPNDVELFEVASIKVAPEDGHEIAKNAADRVVSGNGEALYDTVIRLTEGERR